VEQHAVIAHFDYAADSLDALYEREKESEAAINAAGVGEFDGNEIAVDLSDGSLYMYGPETEALFTVVRPILAGAECLVIPGSPSDSARHRMTSRSVLRG
jgi:hypothetical protein